MNWGGGGGLLYEQGAGTPPGLNLAHFNHCIWIHIIVLNSQLFIYFVL